VLTLDNVLDAWVTTEAFGSYGKELLIVVDACHAGVWVDQLAVMTTAAGTHTSPRLIGLGLGWQEAEEERDGTLNVTVQVRRRHTAVPRR
jgi:hypothetical protein